MEVSIYALHGDVFVWSSKYSINIVFKSKAKYQFLMFNVIIEHIHTHTKYINDWCTSISHTF